MRYDALINKHENSFFNEKQLIPAFNRSERKTAKKIYKILNNSLNDIRDEAVRKNLEILSTQNPKINLLQQELQSDYRKIFFENKIPIGFSHKNNYRNLYNHRLFCVNPKYSDFYIKLGEVMTYKYEIAEERRDFSPRNGKYVILKNQSVTLKKVATKKILEALVFSDFMGFKKDNPNGLVQFELNKRINTNTFRRQSYRSDFGWIQYATPTFTYNKLENKENAFVNSPNVSQRSDTLNIFSRGDTLRYLGDQITNAKYQITPIDLLRYQQFSTGLDINILDLSINTVKTTFNMNAGLKFGQSRIIDSLYTTRDDTLSRQSTNNVLLKTDIFTNGLVKESKVNTLQWTLECSALISPELRYGFKATYRILAMNMFSSDYDLVSEIGTRVRRTGWVHQAELLGYFNPNSTGKLFFRYRFNFNNKDLDYNFSQLQLGYSFYLVK